ncbi:M12 family metallo-peptidase [Fluviicola sp.]|uniref:M12 family metallo-peptidase n=1 Tax=Fluviicola sp. TaxID=1917219 RepID=UPI002835C37B|nr:M12 family metallo-peptidase [Fluviicola sp.]MDR0802731.1 zinc-dependent metalloprotease [Fluviicola sp.]
MNSLNNIQRIEDMFNTVNQIYQSNHVPTYSCSNPNVLPDTRIRIILDSIYFVPDPTPDSVYYYGTGNSSYHYANFSALDNFMKTNYPTSQYAMNYFMTGGVYPGAAGMSPAGGGISCQSFYRHNPEMNATNDYDWSYAFHFAHEIGHNLGLQHTYDSNSQTCHSSSVDFLSDAFDNSISCSDSSSGPSANCTVCLLPAAPENNNCMGGGTNWTYTSALQCGIMHRRLMAWPVSGSARTMRDFTNGYSAVPMDIPASETWDFPVKMYQDLVVKPGVTLTIKCEVQFVKEASLIIEPGARVIIDGGKLTNEWHDHTYWQGVQVWGTSNQYQYPAYQGYLNLINGAMIENAVNGARNWKPDDYNKIGGVIVSNGGIFKNNRRAVEFVTYRNFAISNPLITRPNSSNFSNTRSP